VFSNKSWEPEAVLALIGGIVGAFFAGSVAVLLLQQAGVSGFKSEFSAGTILLGTFSSHGAAIVLGTIFLKMHGPGWREVFGSTGWKRCLALVAGVMAVAVPVMLGLKYISEMALLYLHWPVEDQLPVKMIITARPWVRVYLAFWAVAMAPLAEEFFFRGLLFSTAKKFGWPKLGWFGVSFLFALMHANAPTFLPLFVLALALTWLCEKTGGLLAPIIAHCLFNAVNLIILLLALRYNLVGP
jgi:membrane protease YdiL (CAAX protease family)